MAITVTIKRGDTWQADFLFRENDATADLTGCTARLQVRTKADVLILTASTNAPTDPVTVGFLEVDGSAGKVSLSVDKALMTGITPAKYYADLELTYPDGTVRSSDTFTVNVRKDITL